MITSHLMCANFFMINLNVIITFMLQHFNHNRETMAKHVTCRSSRAEVFCKKGVLKISQNLLENTCARVFFLVKLQALLKKRLWHRCFLVNFLKFLRTPFFTEHLWWLVLYMIKPSRHYEFGILKSPFLIEAAVYRCFSK